MHKHLIRWKNKQIKKARNCCKKWKKQLINMIIIVNGPTHGNNYYIMLINTTECKIV